MKEIIHKGDIGPGVTIVDMWHGAAELPRQVFNQNVIAVFKSPLTCLYTNRKKETRTVIEEGDVGVYSAGVYDFIRNYNPVRKLHLYLTPECLTTVLNNNHQPSNIELVTNFHTKDHLIKELVLAIHRESQQASPDKIYMDTLLCTLIVHLSKNYAHTGTTVAPVGRLRENEVYQIRNFILSHLEEKFSLADLASVVNLSPFHFARLFKNATGMSPYLFVRNTRVSYAKDLMKSKLTIAEVAIRAGFHDESHFSKIFKQITGASPSTFKKAGKYQESARK